MSIRIATGPPVASATKEQATSALTQLPHFPKNAEVEVFSDGKLWKAAIHTPEEGQNAGWSREAEFPPAKEEKEEGPPKDEAPDAGPSDEGGGEEPSLDGPPSPDGEDGDAPKDEHGEKGQSHELAEIAGLVHAIADALGIAPAMGPGAPGENAAPGEEQPPPPGPPGPPHAPHGGPAGPDQTVQHQRALKPGEAPPGATPVGAPAFASVAIPDDHPWKSVMGKVATFSCENEIPENVSIAKVNQEMDRLAYGTGFKVKQIKESRGPDGQRIAKVLVSSY